MSDFAGQVVVRRQIGGPIVVLPRAGFGLFVIEPLAVAPSGSI